MTLSTSVATSVEAARMGADLPPMPLSGAHLPLRICVEVVTDLLGRYQASLSFAP